MYDSCDDLLATMTNQHEPSIHHHKADNSFRFTMTNHQFNYHQPLTTFIHHGFTIMNHYPLAI